MVTTETKPLLDSNAMYKRLLEVGEAWADARSAYQALDDATKSVLADIMQGYRDTAPTLGVTAAETLALRSQPFRDHLASVSVANRAYLRSQVKYDSLKALIELRRSEESTRRAELQL